MARQLVVWGPPHYPLGSSEAATREANHSYANRCASAGVTKLVPGGGSRGLVEAAHEKGLEVHPYNAFPAHGGMPIAYGQWSTSFVRSGIESPEGRPLLDQHRPIYAGPTAAVSVSDFARAHPEYWARKRVDADRLVPGESLALSLSHQEVRDHEASVYLDMLRTTGGDGVQVEFVLGNEDDNGVTTYGYEDRTAGEFTQRYGKSPFAIPNDDPDWMQFRADCVTRFLEELRMKVKAANPNAVLSTTLIANDAEDYIKLSQDWPAWVEKGLIDEFYLWFRTNSNLADLERHTTHAADIIGGRVPLIAELSCYHPGSFQQPEAMLEGAHAALSSGADAVGVYRSHAVEQLDFWCVLEEIAKL